MTDNIPAEARPLPAELTQPQAGPPAPAPRQALQQVRVLLILAALLVLAASLVAYMLGVRSAGLRTATAPAETSQSLKIRPLAPAFALPSLRPSERISLAEFKGQVVVLNFFASWCGPCALEASDLERTWQRNRGRGVVFLGVAIQDRYPDAQAFLRQHGITYPAVFDADGSVMMAYRVTAIPTTVFIDPEGRIRGRHAGIFVGDEGVARLQERIDAAREVRR